MVRKTTQRTFSVFERPNQAESSGIYCVPQVVPPPPPPLLSPETLAAFNSAVGISATAAAITLGPAAAVPLFYSLQRLVMYTQLAILGGSATQELAQSMAWAMGLVYTSDET